MQWQDVQRYEGETSSRVSVSPVQLAASHRAHANAVPISISPSNPAATGDADQPTRSESVGAGRIATQAAVMHEH
jgi:hypothetical protein